MGNDNKSARKSVKIILPLLILILGIGGFVALNNMKKAPQRQKPAQLGVLVDVIELKPEPHQLKVHATGTVSPQQEISLVPEVSGKVIWLAPQLVNGGRFRQGEKMLKIDPRDYQLAVEKAQADVARAQVALRTEQERAQVARQEWARIDLPNKGEPGPLVTREIQLQQELANLAAAKASLQQAQLNLQRTELESPFAGRIRQEQVDLGQYLRAGTSIATYTGTDRAEIHIPLPVAELRWLRIPVAGSNAPGSAAIISLPENPAARWQGTIIRSLGEIDAASRMATVVIEVTDPYQLQADATGSVLQNGQFVEIQLLGEQLDQAISIPRDALRSGQKVWIADAENRLRLRPVKVLRREQHQLLLEEGVAAGEHLILTTLPGATEGLLLRPVLQESNR